jgi:predicted dehydrogenase
MKVAILGCGRAGAQHAEAVAAAGGGVAAVCDNDRDLARSLSLRTRAPVRDLAGLLEDPAVDAVAVCTPPGSHLRLGLQVLAAGRAAVIEKPPALSREGIEGLEAASRKRGQPLAVMFQHRGRLPAEALESEWSPSASAVVEVFRSRPAAHYAERTWRGDPRRSGGGFFAHLAIHYADLACQLLGEPEQVHAIAETGQTPGIDIRATLTARMTSGALLTVHASSLPQARQERLHLLDGTRSLTLTNTYTRYAENGREHTAPAPPTNDLRASVYREVDAAIQTERPVRRFGAAASSGSVSMLEHVIGAMTKASDEWHAPTPAGD